MEPTAAHDAAQASDGAPNGAAEPVQGGATPATAGIPGITHASGRNDPRRRLGDVIIDLGYADRELVEQMLSKEDESTRPLGELLVQSGSVTSSQLAHALAERNTLDFADLNSFAVDPGAANLVSAVRGAAATERSRSRSSPDGSLLVADLGSLQRARAWTTSRRRPATRSAAQSPPPDGIDAVLSSQLSRPATRSSRSRTSRKRTRRETSSSPSSSTCASPPLDAPVVKLVHAIIADAVARGASDIHFDPGRRGDARALPHRRRRPVDSDDRPQEADPRDRLAGSRSWPSLTSPSAAYAPGWPRGAERRRPPHRPARRHPAGDPRRVRGHADPGQGTVCASTSTEPRDALDEDQAQVLHRCQAGPGAVMVTGPTGSGKTTTLYALMNVVNDARRTTDENRGSRRVPVGRRQPDPGQPEGGLRSPPGCARWSARTPTSSWLARSATPRRRASPSSPRSPGTWCSRRFTPTTPRSRLPA